MKQFSKSEEKEFNEILKNGGCAFISKDGVMYNSMRYYPQETYYVLDTKSGLDYYFNPPILEMQQMYLKYKKYGCSIRF
jgi:hypothetical protein